VSEKRRLVQFRPIQFLLYLGLRTVVMVVEMFPYRSAPAIGRFLGRLLYMIDRKHVRIAAKNLHRTRGVCPPDEVPAFILRIYRHVARCFIEMLMVPRLMQQEQVSRYVTQQRFHVFDQCLKEGKGCIAIIGHLGNWELIGIAASMTGYPLHTLMRPIDNPWIDRYLRTFRGHTGQQMIDRNRALGEMIRVIQRNKILIVQVDQDARESGVFVNFFGRPASAHRAPATLALKYNAPIVFADIYREGDMNYCVLADPIRADAFRDHPDPVKALTQAYTDVMEQAVRRHPDQWFWIHDRWKTAERTARETSTSLV
jgi:KDO2-lipid IV(A) lauroyltransferase